MDVITTLTMMQESASTDILYHSAEAYSALLIMKANAFKLPFAETNASETRNKKPIALYYLSTARTLGSGYIADRASGLRAVDLSTTFVLDIVKIKRMNRGIKIRSFDYWGMDETGRKYGSAREAEERIYSNDRTLKLKGAYSVLLVVDPTNAHYNERQVYSFCLKNRIPIKIFTIKNLSGFRSQKEDPDDRRIAVEALRTVKRTHSYITSHKGISPLYSKTSKKFFKEKYNDTTVREFEAIKLLVEKNDVRDIPPAVRSRYLWLQGSLFEFMASYIHNLRGDIRHGKEEMDKLDVLIKKMKVKSLKEFFDKLEKKWDKLVEENRVREQREYEAKHAERIRGTVE